MKLSKFSILSAFVFLTLITSSGHVFAAEDSTVKTSEDVQSAKPTLVGTVGIENARILSQEGNTFNIAFSISNKEIIQTGVKYGIQLIPEGAKYIADEKVYEESITLNENTELKREVTYVAPSFLSGSYTMLLLSRSENNFPFSVSSLGNVKLIATTKGIKITNDSCYLNVEGEKGSPRYTLTQHVDISKGEQLKLTCNAINEGEAVTVSPFYETRFSGSFGKIAPQIGGDYAPIKFTKGEKKTFSLLLPKGEIAQFYSLKFSLMNKNIPSNSISIGYIIRGFSASIQKVSLDKDYYKAGEKGEISVLWSASSGNFARSGAKENSIPKISFSVKITNSKGRECTNYITDELNRDSNNPETKIPFKLKSTCLDPHVAITLRDADDNVLDQKDFTFKSNPLNIKPISKTSIALIALGLLAILGLGVYMKKKKEVNVNKK